MRRFLLISLSLLIVVLAIVTGVTWYLLQDEDFLKSQLTDYVQQQTGRELRVDGPLQLTLGRLTTVEASGIHLANAAWADEPEMARIGHLRVAVNIPSLFTDTPVIPLLAVEDCSLTLVERDDGQANWDMLPESADNVETEPGESNRIPFSLLDAAVHDCRLSHSAPHREQPLLVEVEELSLQLSEDQRSRISGAGRIGGEPVRIDGWMAPARALILGGPLEHRLDVNVGEVSLRSSGTLQDAATGQGANIELDFHGPELTRVLGLLGLPSFSSGPFDFRLSLDTEAQLTRLNVEGNLGDLRTHVEGELDRLVHPSQGAVRGTLEGPDLASLGSTLGIEGLAPTPYALDVDMGFEPGLVRFRGFKLDMPDDGLSVLGVLGTGKSLAGTDLDITVRSTELGRWAPAFGQPVRVVGAATLAARLLSDANGAGSVQARAELLESSLTLNGSLGNLAEPLQPDLEVDFHSSDPRQLAGLFGEFSMPRAPLAIRGHIAGNADLLKLEGVDVSLGGHSAHLEGQVNPASPFTGSDIALEVRSPNAADLGAMFGREDLPVAPFTLSGRVSRPDQRIQLKDVALDLAGNRVGVSGYINPDEKFAGSELELQLDTPDVAALALLFGKDGLPHEPMALGAVLTPEGKGMKIQTRQGQVGDILLALDGRIPDLAEPLRLDAQFDVRLPSLQLLGFLTPETDLPDLPFTAQGKVRNKPDRTQIENVEFGLGTFAARLSGDFFTDRRFELAVRISGPDASQLEPWLKQPLAPKPFALSTRIAGDPSAFELADLDAKVGDSQASGNLRVQLGDPIRVSGQLESPYLDFSHWTTGKEEQPEAPPGSESPYVFDDTPIFTLADYGVDLDISASAAVLDLGNTRIRDIELGLRLAGKKLQVDPLSLRGETGTGVELHGVLDGSGVKPRLHVEAQGEGVRLGLAATEDQDIATYPKTDFYVLMEGVGMTRREMASSLNGKIRIHAGPGQIASAGVALLFSDFVTELFQALNPFAEKSKYTRMDCEVIAADISDGRVDVSPVVFQTEPITVLSQGSIDLRSEKIDLSFNSKPRKGLGISAGTLINPWIKVGGSLKRPAVELDPGSAAIASGTAVATAGLSILAKGFSDRFLSSKDPCGDALKEIEERDR